MPLRNYRITFDRMPCTRALWDKMLEFSRSYPGFALVSDSPFIVNSNEEEEFPIGSMYLHPVEETDSCSVLWRELLTIENMVREGCCSQQEILHIEEGSRNLLRSIEDAARATDVQYCRYLRSINRMN